MRMRFAIPLLVTLPSCTQAAPAQTPCQVAVGYLERTLPRMKAPAIVFEGEPSDPRSVLSSRPVRDLLAQRGIRYGPDAVARAVDVPNHGPFKAAILTVSMPKLSDRDRTAEMRVGTQYAPLGGHDRKIIMTRSPNGTWTISDEEPTWIS